MSSSVLTFWSAMSFSRTSLPYLGCIYCNLDFMVVHCIRQAKDVIKTIKKRLTNRSPMVQLLALTVGGHLCYSPWSWATNLNLGFWFNIVYKSCVWRSYEQDGYLSFSVQVLETLVKNCGDNVHQQVQDRGVLQEMVKIVKKKVSPSNFGFSIWSVFAQGTCLMLVFHGIFLVSTSKMWAEVLIQTAAPGCISWNHILGVVVKLLRSFACCNCKLISSYYPVLSLECALEPQLRKWLTFFWG